MAEGGTMRMQTLMAVPIAAATLHHAWAADYTCVYGDNAPKINQLLSQLVSGETLGIGAGSCEIDSGLTMTVPGTALVGAGPGQYGTKIFIPAGSGNIFDMLTVGIAGGRYHGAGFTIMKLSFDGHITSRYPGTGTGRGIRIVAGVYADALHAFGVSLSHIAASELVGGISVAGSDVTAVDMYLHDNRHSAFVALGGASHRIAHDITLKGSVIARNELDNAPGKTYDSIYIGPFTSGVTIGGPAASDGNKVTGGDILFACPPSMGVCATPIGPFLAQNNSVTTGGTTGHRDALRLYGDVTQAKVDRNTISALGIGVYAYGAVTESTISDNAISNRVGTGVVLQQLPGGAPGNSIMIDGNKVSVLRSTIAFSVVSDTNVTLQDNDAYGSGYSVSRAGAGLTLIGNH